MEMFLILRVGPIYRIPGIINQFEYIKIFKEVMLLYAEEVMPWKCVFQQDNDPKHTSKPVAVVGLMDRALDLKPEVTQGCGFESRLR